MLAERVLDALYEGLTRSGTHRATQQPGGMASVCTRTGLKSTREQNRIARDSRRRDGGAVGGSIGTVVTGAALAAVTTRARTRARTLALTLPRALPSVFSRLLAARGAVNAVRRATHRAHSQPLTPGLFVIGHQPLHIEIASDTDTLMKRSPKSVSLVQRRGPSWAPWM